MGIVNTLLAMISLVHIRQITIVLFLATTTGTAHADFTGRVVAVTDGDTIKVLDSTNTQYKVRLRGIDSPEKGQPYGTASKTNLASIVAGKEVFVESVKNDRYFNLGRHLVRAQHYRDLRVSAFSEWSRTIA
jgi:endonuclease YncB( thermonuclease family)